MGAEKGISTRDDRNAKEVEELKSVRCQSSCSWRKRPDGKA